MELRFDIDECAALDGTDEDRASERSRRTMLDSEGRLVLVSQKTRDQPRNLEDAREKLRDLVLKALIRPKKRRPTRPSRGAVARRLQEKSHAAQKKRERSARDKD